MRQANLLWQPPLRFPTLTARKISRHRSATVQPSRTVEQQMQAILGLTQSNLAALLGVSRAVLSLSAQPGRGPAGGGICC